MTHEVHPKKIVKTDKGNIVLELPDLARTSALSNSIYTYILTEKDLLEINQITDEKEKDKFIKVRTLKKGFTTFQLSILAYVTSAPFHLNDYTVEPLLDLKSFLEFADTSLLNEMAEKVKELGMIDPLQP